MVAPLHLFSLYVKDNTLDRLGRGERNGLAIGVDGGLESERGDRRERDEFEGFWPARVRR